MKFVYSLHASLLVANAVCAILNGMMFLKYGNPLNALCAIFNGGVAAFLALSFPLLFSLYEEE